MWDVGVHEGERECKVWMDIHEGEGEWDEGCDSVCTFLDPFRSLTANATPLVYFPTRM